MLAIRISPDIERRLQQLAQKTGRTKSYYAREAILRFIEETEDELLALSRLAEPTKRWTLDELEQGIDLEDLSIVSACPMRIKTNNFFNKLLVFLKKIKNIFQI